MKTQDTAKEIKTCSRCGLCAQVCPIYEIKKNEVSLCRGKFLQLLGILRGDLKYNKKIEKNLRFCINCGKCTLNCPSEINTVNILSQIKYQKMSIVRHFLTSEFVFNLKLLPVKILNFFPFKKLPELDKGKIYFKGCLSTYNESSPFKCCAVPFFVDGRLDIYEKLVQHNLRIIENDSVEKVFFDCATCFNEVKKYPFKNPKSINKLRFFDPVNSFCQKIKNRSFTFFRPCHMQIDDFEKVEKMFKKIPNYKPLEISQRNYQEKHCCCGFGGDFFIRHPFVAHKLSIKLAQKIYETGAEVVITPCPTCIWSLKWGLWFLKTFKSLLRNVKVLGL